MSGEKNLIELIKGMKPRKNEGEYVFVSVQDLNEIDRDIPICIFKEHEGITLVIDKNKADGLGYSYDFVASWITLMIHSSLEAVGLTPLFSAELAKNDISSNVIAGFYHDHIFVDRKDADKAIQVLEHLAKRYR